MVLESSVAAKFLVLLPELILAFFSLFVILFDLFSKEKKAPALHYITLLGFSLSFLSLVFLFDAREIVWDGVLIVDKFSQFFKIIFTLIGLFVAASALQLKEIKNEGEYYALLFLAALGMMLVASSGELITLYVSLELATLSTFALAAYSGKKEASEAGFKYFIIGALSSAIIAFGFSFVYGVTGETKLNLISSAISAASQNFTPLLLLGIVLIIAGFGFEIAAVPFHLWVPDTYQGAPTSTTILLATAIEAMGFAALFRIFGVSLDTFRELWIAVFAALSFLTMTYGNVAALSQKNVKRLLAYSSIGHAGFILMAFAAFTPLGIAGGVLHLLAYLFMNAGAFAIAGYFSTAFNANSYEEYAGLRDLAPFSSFFLLLFLFSLAGIPPLAGFLSKLVLFAAAIDAKLVWLAAVGVVNTAISVYYYVRIVKYIYLENLPEGKEKRKAEAGKLFVFIMFLASLATIIIGVLPEKSIGISLEAANALLCKFNLACL